MIYDAVKHLYSLSSRVQSKHSHSDAIVRAKMSVCEGERVHEEMQVKRLMSERERERDEKTHEICARGCE